MLTLFAIPKAFHGHVGVIQRNAVQSWLRLGSECEIMLFGPDAGVAEAAAEFGVRHIPDVACTPLGTPLLSDVIDQAQRLSTHDVLCYVNADILLLDDFPRAVRAVASRRPRFLMVGERGDIDVTVPLDFAGDWQGPIRTQLAERGEFRGPAALDYFVFRRGLWQDMPPFAVGRTTWDNWLIFGARAAGAAVVDASRAITCVHQNHDYNHIPRGKDEVWKGEEARRNYELAGGSRHIYTLKDATALLVGDRLVPALSVPHLRRRLRHIRKHWLPQTAVGAAVRRMVSPA